MKSSNLITAYAFVLLTFIISSCSVVAGIFKAGMGVGIFLVVLVIVVLAGLVMLLLGKSNKP